MVNVEAWYLGGDDEPLSIKNAADAVSLANRVRAESTDHAVPPLIQFEAHSESGWSILQAGFRGEVGVLSYTDRQGASLTHQPDAASSVEVVTYDYMGHLREVPATAEVGAELVVLGIESFVASGGRVPEHSQLESWG